MADLDAQMQQMMKQINQTVPNVSEKQKLTKKGADIFSDKLTNVTRNSHYHVRKIGSVKHLADSIVTSNKTVDGINDGSSSVGFADKNTSGINHGRIAMFLNNGTSRNLKGDHFVDNAREQSQEEVFNAIAQEYKKRTGGS